MTEELKPPGKVLLSREEIHTRIQELGQQITEDYQGKSPLLI